MQRWLLDTSLRSRQLVVRLDETPELLLLDGDAAGLPVVRQIESARRRRTARLTLSRVCEKSLSRVRPKARECRGQRLSRAGTEPDLVLTRDVGHCEPAAVEVAKMDVDPEVERRSAEGKLHGH